MGINALLGLKYQSKARDQYIVSDYLLNTLHYLDRNTTKEVDINISRHMQIYQQTGIDR